MYGGITTMLVAQPVREIVAAENDSNDGHRARLHQMKLGLPVVRTSGALMLLLGDRGLFGLHSAVHDIPQQDCVIAVELADDTHAFVV